MSDLIERESLKSELIKKWNISDDHDFANKDVWEVVEGLPSAEPDDWLEKNKDLILQAGMEGREVEFRIGGRLFAIREKAQ